ncbi:MAG: glucosaminidase domain-containing protein, partial [Bacteroidota bacterium]
LLFVWTTSGAVDRNIEQYIDEFQYIAISEMERTGVPASIKLAQGILESNAGRSTLARKANNHFGIKCGSNWRGRKHYRKDDDYVNGKLIKSCFRGYRNAENSYLAHSDFLLDNRRYRSLFQLNPTDYRKWAKGLKKAGYATSRTYDKKLIRIIEEYKLFRYDAMISSEVGSRVRPSINVAKEIFYINDAKMTFAKAGETAATVAVRTKTSLSRILKYNEQITAGNQSLEVDEKVFIQEKRRNFRGKKRTHTVLQGETMYDISQTYGLCLDRLYKKNKMEQGTQPAIGASVQIRGRAKKRPPLRDKNYTPPPPILIEVVEPVERDEEETMPSTEDNGFKPVLTPPVDKETVPNRPPVVQPPVNPAPIEPTTPDIETRRYHIVVKGETLYRLSRIYGTTVDTIKQLNGLKSNIISVGQRLRIE